MADMAKPDPGDEGGSSDETGGSEGGESSAGGESTTTTGETTTTTDPTTGTTTTTTTTITTTTDPTTTTITITTHTTTQSSQAIQDWGLSLVAGKSGSLGSHGGGSLGGHVGIGGGGGETPIEMQTPGGSQGLDTPTNRRRLAEIMYGEMGNQNGASQAAVGWTVRNRMNQGFAGNSNANVPQSTYSVKSNPPQPILDLASKLLKAPMTDDTTNGAVFFLSPQSMPDVAHQGCCTGNPAPCVPGTATKPESDCKGGLRLVPGTSEYRFYPSWAHPGKLQPQPAGTTAMVIQVYRG